jgi:glycosyltransferase involved in cell wall biosynthesis
MESADQVIHEKLGSAAIERNQMSLKIGLVARCLNTEHVRGMGKYVYELLSHSQHHPEVRWHLFGDDLRYGMVTPPAANLTIDIFPFRGDRFRAWEQLGLPLRLRGMDLNLLHCTEGTLSLWQPKPTVVTLHDTLAFEERADALGARAYFDRLLPAALKACAHVITISESSRIDILARWPWLESKLTVIPHGIDEAYFRPDDAKLPESLEHRINGAAYAVYLGGPMKRKRADWAIEVLGASPRKDLKLVMCGFGSAARKEAAEAVPQELRTRVLFAEFLSDAELRALYRGASAVLYPTLYEGFGFPALEAQAAGVPCIFSALGSLKELIGPLAMIVPAHDRDAWVAALDEACTMGEAHLERARAAAKWVRQFRWSESFAKHYAVYQSVGAAHL